MVANEHVVVGAQPLQVDTRAATIDEAEVFGIAPGAPLFELVRLRTLDDLPVAIDSTTLPSVHRSRASRPGLVAGVALRVPDVAAGHGPVSADYAVEAQGRGRPRRSRCWPRATGSPVLVAESEVSDVAGRVIVVGVITYRGDRYRFRSRLTAGSTVPIMRTPARPR